MRGIFYLTHMGISMEIWKQISGYEGLYEVSSFGNVRSLDREVPTSNRWGTVSVKCLKGRILKKKTMTSGYFLVSLCKDSSIQDGSIHRLVGKAFIPNPKNLPCINHKDGNRLNNYAKNLEWSTHKENTAHAITMGLIHHYKGSDSNFAKLTEQQVYEIIGMLSCGVKQRSIAKLFNLSEACISNIKRGRTWAHLKESCPSLMT